MIRFFICFIFLFSLLANAGEENAKWADTWHAFIIHKSGVPLFQTGIKYILHPDNTWSIQEADNSPIQQGWYKIEEHQIFLQPQSAAQQNINAAISAEIVDQDRFEIGNPIDDTRKMRLLRGSLLPVLTEKDLIGKWKIIQKNLYTDETRTAPYTLIFEKDGIYRLEQTGEALPEAWSSGTYAINNGIVTLKNRYSESGFWNQPSFFFLDDQLRYNDSRYSLWCERIDDNSEK